MTEIEKLMENAGCLIVTACHIEYKDGSTCNRLYPTFTAEKQLELIKWLAKNNEDCKVTYDSNYSWATQTFWESSFCYENFEESLANLINRLWQDLTESEKEEIRGILQ